MRQRHFFTFASKGVICHGCKVDRSWSWPQMSGRCRHQERRRDIPPFSNKLPWFYSYTTTRKFLTLQKAPTVECGLSTAVQSGIYRGDRVWGKVSIISTGTECGNQPAPAHPQCSLKAMSYRNPAVPNLFVYQDALTSNNSAHRHILGTALLDSDIKMYHKKTTLYVGAGVHKSRVPRCHGD